MDWTQQTYVPAAAGPGQAIRLVQANRLRRYLGIAVIGATTSIQVSTTPIKTAGDGFTITGAGSQPTLQWWLERHGDLCRGEWWGLCATVPPANIAMVLELLDDGKVVDNGVLELPSGMILGTSDPSTYTPDRMHELTLRMRELPWASRSVRQWR